MARVDIMQIFKNFNMRYHESFGERKKKEEKKNHIRDFQCANDNSSRRASLLPVLANFSTTQPLPMQLALCNKLWVKYILDICIFVDYATTESVIYAST